MKIITQISKSEAAALSQMGYCYNRDLHKTHPRHGKHGHYYATEDKRLMRDLAKLREQRIIAK